MAQGAQGKRTDYMRLVENGRQNENEIRVWLINSFDLLLVVVLRRFIVFEMLVLKKQAEMCAVRMIEIVWSRSYKANISRRCEFINKVKIIVMKHLPILLCCL